MKVLVVMLAFVAICNCDSISPVSKDQGIEHLVSGQIENIRKIRQVTGGFFPGQQYNQYQQQSYDPYQQQYQQQYNPYQQNQYQQYPQQNQYQQYPQQNQYQQYPQQFQGSSGHGGDHGHGHGHGHDHHHHH